MFLINATVIIFIFLMVLYLMVSNNVLITNCVNCHFLWWNCMSSKPMEILIAVKQHVYSMIVMVVYNLRIFGYCAFNHCLDYRICSWHEMLASRSTTINASCYAYNLMSTCPIYLKYWQENVVCSLSWINIFTGNRGKLWH